MHWQWAAEVQESSGTQEARGFGSHRGCYYRRL